MSNEKHEAFEVNLVGNISGQTWIGKFRAKPCLTWRDRINIDRTYRELVGGTGNTDDVGVAAMAKIVSQLSFRLTETPQWWKEAQGGLDLIDSNVIEEVFQKAKDIEEQYYKKLEEETNKNISILKAKK